MEDLTSIIEDSITDAELPEPVDTPAEPVETAPEPAEAPVEANPAEPVSDKVPTPAEPKEEDDFDKKFGLSATSQSGRENRIPYGRVRKIVDKAKAEAIAAKVKEYETTHTPLTKFTELQTKVKEYEERFNSMAGFENLLVNNPAGFLTTLVQKVPGYAQILAPLFQQGPAATQPTQPQSDDMPQPDQTLADGSKVYSMDGIRALQAWSAKQAKAEAVKELEQRYAPIEKEFNAQQRIQQALPIVNKQIEEARKLPLFNESENEIVDALKRNPSWTLERAYQSVVVPKLQAQRDQIRGEVLKELKSAPRSTAVTASPSRAVTEPKAGPRSLEEIIRESIKPLKQ